jgi:hypothetical protein
MAILPSIQELIMEYHDGECSLPNMEGMAYQVNSTWYTDAYAAEAAVSVGDAVLVYWHGQFHCRVQY